MTVISSAIAPSSSLTFSLTVCSSWTTIPSRTSGLKPGMLKLTRYVPGVRAKMR